MIDGGAVADQPRAAGPVRGGCLAAPAQHRPAVRVAEGVPQPHRIGRGGVVVAQVFDYQFAAGRAFQVARLEHADPLHLAVAPQEGVEFGRPVQLAVVHQQPDQVIVAAQFARGFGQAGDMVDLPVIQGAARQRARPACVRGNAKQAFMRHRSSVWCQAGPHGARACSPRAPCAADVPCSSGKAEEDRSILKLLKARNQEQNCR